MYFYNEIDKMENIKGTILILGESDSGKSTFAKELSYKIKDSSFLDLDIGQSTIGYPSVQTLKYKDYKKEWFIGTFSPVGHFLDFIIGAKKLLHKSFEKESKNCLVDTTGFIDEKYGGVLLKQSLIEILNPTYIIALQKEKELEKILYPYEKAKRVKVIRIKVRKETKVKNKNFRKFIKIKKLREYFKDSYIEKIDIEKIAVIGKYPLLNNQLISFLDNEGFMKSLALIKKIEKNNLIIKISKNKNNLKMIKTGKILLDEDFNYSYIN